MWFLRWSRVWLPIWRCLFWEEPWRERIIGDANELVTGARVSVQSESFRVEWATIDAENIRIPIPTQGGTVCDWRTCQTRPINLLHSKQQLSVASWDLMSKSNWRETHPFFLTEVQSGRTRGRKVNLALLDKSTRARWKDGGAMLFSWSSWKLAKSAAGLRNIFVKFESSLMSCMIIFLE